MGWWWKSMFGSVGKGWWNGPQLQAQNPKGSGAVQTCGGGRKLAVNQNSFDAQNSGGCWPHQCKMSLGLEEQSGWGIHWTGLDWSEAQSSNTEVQEHNESRLNQIKCTILLWAGQKLHSISSIRHCFLALCHWWNSEGDGDFSWCVLDLAVSFGWFQIPNWNPNSHLPNQFGAFPLHWPCLTTLHSSSTSIVQVNSTVQNRLLQCLVQGGTEDQMSSTIAVRVQVPGRIEMWKC